MKTFFKSLVTVGVVAVALMRAPAAHAQCSAGSEAIGHFLGTVWSNLPEAALTGRVYQVSNPATNNGTANFICKSGTQFNGVRQACPGNVRPRNLSVFRVHFQRYQATASGQRTREPDCAVSAKRADFENRTCALNSGQEMQEFSLWRGDLNGGQTRLGASAEGRFQGRVRRNQQIGDVVVNGCPLFLAH